MDTRITVRELKEALDDYPDDLPVEFMDDYGKQHYIDKDDLDGNLALSTPDNSYLEVSLRFVPDDPEDDPDDPGDDPEPSPPASRYNWAKAIVQ